MSDDYIPIPAAPRRPDLMAGTYTGAELQMRSPRAGAYDAFALPSLFNGKRRDRDQPPEQAVVYVPPPPAPSSVATARVMPGAPHAQPLAIAPRAAPPITAAAPKRQYVQTRLRPLKPPKRGVGSIAEYHCRTGSTPDRVIKALQAEGGHLTYAQIAARFDVVHNHITAIFGSAVRKGALIRLVADGALAMALPGYELPPPSPELVQRLAELNRQRAELSAWQELVRLLERRQRLRQRQSAIVMPVPFITRFPDEQPADEAQES